MARYLVDWGSDSASSREQEPKMEKKPARHERRRWKRFKVGFNTLVNLRGASEVASATDLSEGGVKIAGNPPLTYWDNVRLEFVLPSPSGPKEIRVIGRVKRVLRDEDKAEFGIEFEMVSPDSKKALTEYLEFLLRGMSDEAETKAQNEFKVY